MIMIKPFKCYLVLAGCLFAASLAGRSVSADRIDKPHSNKQRDSIVTQDLCLTEVISYSFRWTIGNFSQFTGNTGDRLLSSIFPPEEKHKHKWQLSAYPKGHKDENFLAVYLRLKSISNDVALPVKAKFKISIINSANQEMNVDIESRVSQFTELNHGEGYYQLVRRDLLLNPESGMLPGDTLTLTCKVDVYTGELSEAPINACRLPNDFRGIFESQLLSDVDIVVAGREFKAHKAILAARSPVFRAMFSYDMRENQLSRVEVGDVDPEVFEQLLRYIYTGNSTWLELTIDHMAEQTNKESTDQISFAVELMGAACKYQLDDLKLACEHHLYKLLTVDSIVDILSLVDQYQALWLRSRALEFAMSHPEELTQVGAWSALAKRSPEFLADILTRQWPFTRQSSGSNTA